MPAQSIVYMHARFDSDADLSTDAVQFSLDKTTWVTGSYVATSTWVNGQYVPNPGLPATVQISDAARPPRSQEMSGYWFRILLGPGKDLAPDVGRSTVYMRAVDSPQEPVFSALINLDF